MKRDYEHLTWLVMHFDVNKQTIRPYDILKHREDYIKRLKKKCESKEQFAENLRRELMRLYWSRCEWELIIEIDGAGRVWLSPWIGSRDPEAAKIDVTDVSDYDWKGFAEEHAFKQGNKQEAKIDVYDQLMYKDRFAELVNYCWHTRLKYERYSPKFA